jgi:hypothetical protein
VGEALHNAVNQGDACVKKEDWHVNIRGFGRSNRLVFIRNPIINLIIDPLTSSFIERKTVMAKMMNPGP